MHLLMRALFISSDQERIFAMYHSLQPHIVRFFPFFLVVLSLVSALCIVICCFHLKSGCLFFPFAGLFEGRVGENSQIEGRKRSCKRIKHRLRGLQTHRINRQLVIENVVTIIFTYIWRT
jgi:hypothetical protein